MSRRIFYIIILLCFYNNGFCQSPDWQWLDLIQGDKDQIVKDIVSDPSNGDFYVVGKWKGNLSSIFPGTGFSTNFSNPRGGYDGFVAKYNSDHTLIWAFKVGGDSEDEINAISIDSDGNIYIAGTIGDGTSYFVGAIGDSNDSNKYSNQTSTNAFIVKYSSGGEFIWLQNSMGLKDANGLLVYAGDDGIYFAGTAIDDTSFDGELISFNTNDQDVFIVKYNESGTKQWFLGWRSNDVDIPTAIYEKDSKLFIAGNFKGEYFKINDIYDLFFPSSSLTNRDNGSTDIFLVAFNTDGTYDWSKSIASVDDDQVTGMVVDDDNIYVTGGIDADAKFPNSFITGTTDNMDPFVSSIKKSDGITNWVNIFACSKDEDQLAQGISFDALDNLIIVGTFKDTLTFEETIPISSGLVTWSEHEAIFVASFDKSSNYVWSKLGGSDNKVSAVAVDGNLNGNIYVAGTMNADLIFDDITYTHDSSTDSYIGLLNLNCDVIAGSISASELILCEGSSSDLTLSGETGNIAWESSLAGADTWTTISGENSSTLNVSPLVDRDYRASVSSDICTLKSNKVEITVVGQPTTATVGSNQDQCGILTSSSLGGNTPTVGEGTWTQLSGPVGSTTTFSNSNLGNSTAEASAYGTYVYRWAIANGICTASSADMTVNYYQTPTADAGSGGDECDLDFTLSATASVGVGTWTKTGGSGNAIFSNVNDPKASVSVDAYDSYEFTWTEVNGSCSSSSAVSVNFYEQPTADAGSGGDECDLDFTLSATASVGVGNWTKTGGSGNAIFSNTSDPKGSVSVDAYGTYEFTWTEVNGMCSSSSAVSVNFYQQPTSNAGLGGDECDLDFILSATASVGMGTWTKTGGSGNVTFLPDANTPNATVSVDVYDSYQFTWTEVNGSCSSSDLVSVNFYEQPTADAGSGGDECDLDFILSATSSVGVGTWTKTGGSGNAIFSNASDPQASVSVDAYDTYEFIWTEVNGSCSSSDLVSVNFYEHPTADAGLGGDECDLDFNLSATASVGLGTWTKTGGSGNAIFSPDANTPNATVSVDSYDSYEFTWTEVNGTCSSSDLVLVNFYEQPTADAGLGGDECDLDFTLSATVSVGLGIWTKTGGSGNAIFSNASDPKAKVSVDAYDTYEFTWTEVNGSCSDNASITVNFYEQPTADAGSGGDECDLDFILSATSSVGLGSWTKTGGSGNAIFSNTSDPKGSVSVDAYGTYEFTWTEVNGMCSSSSAVSVNFYQQPTSNAGLGGDECDLDFILSATASVGMGTWTKTGGSGNVTFLPDTNTPNATVLVDAYDTYEFTWTEVNGSCSSSDVVSVNFYEQPTADAGSGGDECDLDFTLSAIASVGVGTWTKTGGSGNVTFLPNANTPNATVLVDAYDTYEFTWTEVNGSCSSSDLVSVNFYEQPTADAGLGGDECDLDFILSATSSVGLGTWTKTGGSGNATFSNVNDPKASVSVDAYDTYEFTWTEVNGSCSSSDAVLVNFYEQPTADAGLGGDECDLDFNLSAIASVGLGIWTKTDGSGNAIFSNVNDPKASVSVDAYDSYEFTWTEVNGSCSSSDFVSVNFYEHPTADAGLGGDECDLDFTLSALASVGLGTWTKTGGSGTATFSPDANTPNATVLVDAYDTYEFTWTEVNGSCSDNASITVNFYEQPIADAGSGGDECDLDFTLSALASVGLGTWTKTGGSGNAIFSNANTANATVSVDAYDTYEFTWTEVNGSCSSSDLVSVNFYEQPTANAGLGGDECDLDFNLSALASVGVGNWTKTGGSGNAIFSPDANTPNATVSVDVYDSYEFTWTEVNGSCSSSDLVSVNFYEQPTADAGLGGDECDLDFTLSATASVGLGTWTKTGGSGNAIFSNTSDPKGSVSVDAYGTYEFTWTEVNGTCSSSSAVSVNFYEQPTSNAGLGGDECDLDFTLSAVASVGLGTWTKTGGSGTATFLPDTNTPDAKVSVDAYDSYEFTWTEVNGTCSSSDLVSVNFYEQPTADAGSGGDECDLDFTLSAVASVGLGTWTKTGGSGNAIFSPDANTPNATVLVDAYDTYEFTWTEVNGSCSSSDLVSVNFYELPTADAGLGGDECDLDFTLSATASVGLGTWTKTGGSGNAIFSNASDPKATVFVDVYDTYEFTWTEVNGSCSSSDLVSVNFYEQPTTDAGLGGDECDLDFTLSATASVGVGTWTKTGGSGNAIFSNANTPNATVSVDAYDSYEFTWTEVNGSCSSSSAVSVNFYEQPTANAGLGGDECDLDFTLSAVASVGVGTWTKTGGSGNAIFSNASDPQASVLVDAYDTYEFTWTEVNGSCSSSDLVSVNFYEQPTANAGLGGDECDLDFTLSAVASVGVGTWTKTGGSGNAIFTNVNDPKASVLVDVYDTYEFTWTEVNGSCSSSDLVSVNFYKQPTADAGLGGDECDLDFTLSALASVGVGTWTKTGGSGNAIFTNVNDPKTSVSVDAYDTYEFTWTEVNGTCSDDASITVNFYEQPTADAGLGGDECDLDFTLSATASVGLGTWTKTGGSGNVTFSPDANTANATVSVDAYDSYEFTWTEVNGTCSSSSAVSVNFYEEPTADAGLGGDECDLDFTLSATASVGSGTWTKTGGSGTATFSPDANTPNATVLVDAYDTYEFTWTEVNGSCSSSDLVSVNFYEQPIADAGLGGDECDLDFTLSATASVGLGTWTKTGGSGNATFLPDANTANATVSVDAYDTYEFTWTEVNGTCSSSDAVLVTDNEAPLKEDDRFIDVCGLEYNLQETSALFGGEWVLNSGPGDLVFEPNSTTSDVQIKVSEYGEYEITWEESNGVCEIQNRFFIHFYKVPIAFAGEDIVLGYSEIITLNAKLSTDGFGEWSILSGSGNIYDINSATTEVDELSAGNNVFLWRETNNTCEDQDTVQIKVDDFFIPTVITPNGDGKNDLFIIKGVDRIKRIELIIFNRRGNRVFIDTNYKNTWEGTDNQGRELNLGTYFYVIKIDDNKVFKGSLVIKR